MTRAANFVRLPKATIANAAVLSNTIKVTRCTLQNITCPSNLRGVATVTILHSPTGIAGTFTVLKQLNSATSYAITLTASSTVPIDPTLTDGLGYIQFVPNTAPNADLVLELGGKQKA